MCPRDLWAVLPCFYLFLNHVLATSSTAATAHILSSIVNGSTYDVTIRPDGLDPNKTDPVLIQAQVEILSVNCFDDLNQEVCIQFIWTLSWIDPRHRFEHLYPNPPNQILISDASRIWFPDIFLLNGKSTYHHTGLKPNMMIRIYKNGTTYFSSRITIRMYCSMNLRWYPFDKHNCSLILGLYSLTKKEAKLVWHPQQSFQSPGDGTVDLYMFELGRCHVISDTQDTITMSGNFSHLEIELEFMRRNRYYLFKTFVPWCLLVFISSVGFWLDVGAIEARVALGITTILATATQKDGMGTTEPAVSYIKAIDVYTSVCQWLVTTAFIESAAVYFLSRKYGKGLRSNRNFSADGETPPSPRSLYNRKRPRNVIFYDEYPRLTPMKLDGEFSPSDDDIGRQKGARVDKIARVMFPSLFIAFLVVYFKICLSR